MTSFQDGQNPLTPDFDRNSNPGRLVTDRFDFARHYEGVAFRHDATMIDLKPDLTIGADFCTTVQEALEALLGIIGPSPFTLATIGTTTANLGIVTLGGDFGGTSYTTRNCYSRPCHFHVTSVKWKRFNMEFVNWLDAHPIFWRFYCRRRPVWNVYFANRYWLARQTS